MKYILKYKTKSKYFGFAREEYKEFDSKDKVYQFITSKQIKQWIVYERKNKGDK